MKSQNVKLTKNEAIGLARKGGFKGSPGFKASKSVRTAFGEGLVRGWLRSLGYHVKDESLLIKAEDYDLEVAYFFERSKTSPRDSPLLRRARHLKARFVFHQSEPHPNSEICHKGNVDQV